MNTLKAPDPFKMLYRAKWNIPKATEAMGLPANEACWLEVKVAFREWCVANGPDYEGG